MAALATLRSASPSLHERGCSFEWEEWDDSGDAFGRVTNSRLVRPYLDCPSDCDYPKYLMGLTFERSFSVTFENEDAAWDSIIDNVESQKYGQANFNKTVVIPFDSADIEEKAGNGMGLYVFNAENVCLKGRLRDCGEVPEFGNGGDEVDEDTPILACGLRPK